MEMAFPSVPLPAGSPISFTPTFHSATGRPYRVVVVNNNSAKFLTLHTTQKIPNIH